MTEVDLLEVYFNYVYFAEDLFIFKQISELFNFTTFENDYFRFNCTKCTQFNLF